MTEYVRTMGVVIGAYGLDPTKPKGTAWCYGAEPTGASDYEWRAAMTTPPETVGIDVNPLTGAFQASSFDFEIAFTDEVAELFLDQQRRTDLFVDADITASSISVDIVDSDGTAVSNLDVASMIYIGDEALRISGRSGNTYSLQRGRYSTSAQPHFAGDFVYQTPQSLRYREMLLVLYDWENQTESVIWRGYVDDVTTSTTGEVLRFQGRELYGVLQSARVNRGAVNHVENSTWQSASDILKNDKPYIGRIQLSGDGTSSVFKSGEADPYVALQYDDYAFGFNQYDLSEKEFKFGVNAAAWSQSFERVSAEEADVGEQFNAIYEVFLIDYAMDSTRILDDGTASSSMSDFGFSATRELERPFHPLAIALALILSTTSNTASASDYDVLNGRQSLQLNPDVVDIASFEDLIDRFPTWRVERMVLGVDGEAVNVWEAIRDYCLRPFGCYFGVTDDGKLNVSYLSTNLSVSDFFESTQLTAIPPTLQWLSSRQDAVDEVIGRTVVSPWKEPAVITVRGPQIGNKNSVRQRLFADKRTLEYQIPYGPQTADIDDAVSAFALLESRAASGAYATPRVVMGFQDPDIDAVNYDIGTIVSVTDLDLADAWIVDENGNRIQITGRDIALTGPIVGRAYNPETLTYELTMLLQGQATGQIVYWRAPSAVVGSGSTTTNIVVEQNAFHADDNDTSFFTVGDDIMIANADGSGPGGSASITSIGATSLTVSPALVVAPAAGEIVRLIFYGDYDNTAVISGAGANVWVYVSTDGSDLGGSDDVRRFG